MRLIKYQRLYDELGLTPEQAAAIDEALAKESQYRRLLLAAGINPSIIEAVSNLTDTAQVDLSSEEERRLEMEKIRLQWL